MDLPGLCDLHNNNHQERLAKICKGLAPNGFSFQQHYAFYNGQLQHARSRQKYTLAELEAHEAYQNWRTTNKSHSLVVRGRTNSNTTPLSRLSPVALELGDRLRGEESNDVVIASYFC
jgi:hypothetical protein